MPEVPEIYHLTLDLIMNLLAIFLAISSYYAYKRTGDGIFIMLTIVAVLFAIADISDVIFGHFFNLDFDKYGFHEISTIIFLTIIIIIFNPVWRMRLGKRS